MRTAIPFLVVLLTACPARAGNPADGTLLGSRPYEFPAYAELGALGKALLDEPAYRAFVADTATELSAIDYASDGLRVRGLLCRPAVATAAAPAPVLLWLHGGAGDAAKIGAQNFESIIQIRRFCAAGFVVLAPQYRGVDGGEGSDTVGGDDVADVLALVPLARALDYADGSRIAAWGFSRGAMMALQAVRAGAPLAAVVVIGAGSDFADALRLPDFAADLPAEAKTPAGIERRSPIRWARDLAGVPILFLHGADDPAVPAAGVMELGAALAEADGLYELHVFARDDHGLTAHRDEAFERAVDWFQHVRRRSLAHAFDRALRAGDAARAAAEARRLIRDEPDRWDPAERELNFLGYTYLAQGVPDAAIAVFELNTELHPESWNVWDSLADGYAAAGRTADSERARARSKQLR